MDKNQKPVVAIDISSSKRGGPYISSMNLINSGLKHSFHFETIIYDTSWGRFISLKRIKHIISQIKRIQPDLILITGLQLSGFHVAVAAWLAGVKNRIIVVHGSSLEASGLGAMKKALMYILEFCTFMISTAFYGVSDYASNLSASKYFKNKNKGHIYNLSGLRIPSTCYQKSHFGFGEDDVVVATSGRITREKGYNFLTDAIKKIENPHVKFLIMGDGEYLSEMEEALKDYCSQGRVVFTGFTNEVIENLTATDIFVLPTLHETLSVSLLEAASLSKPLISCAVGGVPEVIEDGYNGILIAPSDSDAICDSIELLSNNEELRLQMGLNAKTKVDKDFATDVIVNRIKELFENELSKQ